MECTCSMSAVGNDFCKVISEKWITARKNHNCQECNGLIRIGEEYHHECEEYDGDITTHSTCADCLSLRKHLVGDFVYGQIRELIKDEIIECDGKIPEKCVARLRPAAREWICELIEEAWRGSKFNV